MVSRFLDEIIFLCCMERLKDLISFCYLLCSMDSTMGIVEDVSCIGRDACKGSKIGNVSDNSCFGDLSCKGSQMTSAGHQSCYGNGTCEVFFINGSLYNSCQDPWMCISPNHNGDLKDLCRGSLDTEFPPPCSGAIMQHYGIAFVMMAMVSVKLLFRGG